MPEYFITYVYYVTKHLIKYPERRRQTQSDEIRFNFDLTDAVFNGGVESVDDSGASVGDPVGLVNGLSELAEQVLSAEQGQIKYWLH